METRRYFDTHEVSKLALYLSQQANQGTPLDYEIRIDELVAVQRTNNPELFFQYEDFILSSSREMCVMIYKGASRVSDKYIYVLADTPAAESVPTFEQKVESALEQYRTEAVRKYEMDKLKGIIDRQRKKIKKQKRKVKGLKKALETAGSETTGLAKVVKDLAGSPTVQGLFSQSGEAATSDLGALPEGMIVGYLKEYREKLGEQTFQELLGTTLVMAQQPELISKVRGFITDQNNAA